MSSLPQPQHREFKFQVGDKVRYIYGEKDRVDIVVSILPGSCYPYECSKPDGSTYRIHESALETVQKV